MNKVIVIAGPTASGKTGLGIEVAKAVGGEIISADSMQVYKNMPIATACPTEEEKIRCRIIWWSFWIMMKASVLQSGASLRKKKSMIFFQEEKCRL